MLVSLIIPTLNAGDCIKLLLESINNQTYHVDEIIIVDSESTDNTVDICKRYKNVRIIQIKRKDFDHGATRNMALCESKGDIVIFMTQDAVPANNKMIENLVTPLINDNNLAVVSGRQLPRNDARLTEKLVREFNYPSVSNVRTKEDISTYGIKTFFCTDVCAAYSREIYLKVGGFEFPLRTNEDMFYAASAINNGYKVAYAADAEVIHSHNFSFRQQYKRNFIQGYEIERHRELLGDVSANTEGMKMVKEISFKLLKKAHFLSFVYFGFDCCARFLGSKMGRKEYLKSIK